MVENTGKSLEDIDIVLNAEHKHWMEIIDWCSKTEGWIFTVDDYRTWLESFEKFWFFFAIAKESNEAVGSVCLAFDRPCNGNTTEDTYYV